MKTKVAIEKPTKSVCQQPLQSSSFSTLNLEYGNFKIVNT